MVYIKKQAKYNATTTTTTAKLPLSTTTTNQQSKYSITNTNNKINTQTKQSVILNDCKL